jgi:hypothetical protein
MEQPDAVGATEIIKLAVPGPRAVQTNVDEFHKLAQPFLEQDCPKIIVDMSEWNLWTVPSWARWSCC